MPMLLTVNFIAWSINVLETVFLDTWHLKCFERLAWKEGLVEPFPDFDGSHLEYGMQQSDPDTILDLVMLFDHVDSYASRFCWDKLASLGLCASKPQAHVWHQDEDVHHNKALRNEKRYVEAKRCAAKVFLDNSSQITSYAQVDTFSLYANTYIDENIIKHIFEEIIKQESTSDAAQIFNMFTTTTSFDDRMYLRDCISQIESYYNSYMTGLYFSMKDNAALSSLLLPRSSKESAGNLRLIEDCMYTVRHKLCEDAILPVPRSIKQSIDLKDTKQIRRLRQLIKQWCAALQAGEQKAESLIRRDFELALADVRRLKGISEFKKSTYFIILNLVGSYIPIFSSILPIVKSGLDIYERQLEFKVSWIGNSK